MAMDPALAGLLGALVGGGFTFAGSILGNTQQARHDREDRLEQRKVETYINAMRSLLRATHYLELTPGVTRTIDDESQGHRTAQFSSWWMDVDRSIQKSIQDMRNAELKKLIPLTTPRLESLTNVSAADYPGTSVNDGDTLDASDWSTVRSTFWAAAAIACR
jgi:hypothetical protein